MQFKLTLALTLSALAAAVPTEYRHDVRGHAAASVIEAGRAIGDAPNAVINGVTNNIIDPVENAAIATAEKAVHAKNVAANAAAQTYNVAAETAYNAKAKTVNTAIDARDTIYETAENAKDGAKHLAHQTEQTTPVQAAEASGHWFMSYFNNAWASVNGAIARRTGRAAARAEESAEYHENALTQNQAQMRENVEAQKAHLAHLKERADIHAANARAKVEENVIEPAVEIKEDVSARTSSTMESIKESAQAKFNTVKNSLRQFGPNPATSVDLGTVKGTYTRYDVNGKLIDEIIETPTLIKEDITVIGEPIAQQVVVPNQVVESSAASLSLIAAAVLVSVQLLI